MAVSAPGRRHPRWAGLLPTPPAGRPRGHPPAAVWGLVAVTIPLTAILAVIAWRIERIGVISTGAMWAIIGVLGLVLALQLRQVGRVNRPALAGEYPPEDQYPFRSVTILAAAYFCSFGSELAVVSMLPTFFAETWSLGPSAAGATASAFAFMNLAARPVGGLLSDRLGSRRRTLRTLLAGLSVGYGGMALLGASWPVPLAVAVTMVCSFFVQASEGAVYAIVPLVKKRVSGQIAGIVGAYGNIGAVCFLTAYLFVSPAVFFLVIGAASTVGVLLCRWLPEPANSFAADLEDEPVAAPVPAASPAPATVRFPTELAPEIDLTAVWAGTAGASARQLAASSVVFSLVFALTVSLARSQESGAATAPAPSPAAVSPGFFAPEVLPDGFSLVSATTTGSGGACPHSEFRWLDPDAFAAMERSSVEDPPYPPHLTVVATPAVCAHSEHGAAPFTAGPHRGSLTRGRDGSAPYLVAFVEVDGTALRLESDLPERDVLRAVASLRPADPAPAVGFGAP